MLTRVISIDNHKPIASSDSAPHEADLKPSSSSSAAYDLTYDDGGKYAFHGSRSTKENQYALIFDPERKAFVLHRIDSTFNMNLIRTPATSDAEALRDEYPHLETTTGRGAASSQAEKKKAGPAKGAGKGKKGSAGMFMENKKTAPKPSKSATTSNKESAASAAAAEKKEKEAAEKEKKQKQQAQRNRSPVASEDEDSDDGFIIEYPDPVDTAPVAMPPVRSRESPYTEIREFKSFIANQEEESDADAEYEEEDFMIEEGGNSSGDGFKLPSPVGRNNNNNGQGGEQVDDDTPEDDELMAMLEEEIGEEGGGMDVDSESSVSEED